MEIADSLPSSQELATGLYPETHESGPHPYTLFIQDPLFNIVLCYSHADEAVRVSATRHYTQHAMSLQSKWMNIIAFENKAVVDMKTKQ
jgi:hypothetical protein